MNIVEGWHPISLSHAVEAGSSAGTRLHGRELVVWRNAGGAAHVWEDRCPHRGMKLSFGFVRGDHLACLYHGWQYNGSGICQYIPAHPDLAVPNTIKVPAYRTLERAGMIWTTLSDNAPELALDNEPTVPLRSLYLDTSPDAAIAALGTVRLRPFVSEGMSDATVDRVTQTLCAVSCGSERLLAGIQTLSDTRVALHLAICGTPNLYEGAGQIHFLDWALRLRHALEQQTSMRAAAHRAA